MHYFSTVPEGQVVTLNRGVYRQSQLFVRDGKLYAKYGAGYVRLHQGGSSSLPNMRWLEIDAGDGSYKESGGAVSYVQPKAVAAE